MLNKSAIVMACVSGVLLSMASSAHAAFLENLTTGTVLFEETFEGAGRVGSPVGTGDATVGTYAGKTSVTSIENETTGGYPARAIASNFPV